MVLFLCADNGVVSGGDNVLFWVVVMVLFWVVMMVVLWGVGGGDVAVLCIWGVGSRSQRTSLQAGVVVEAFSSVQVIS